MAYLPVPELIVCDVEVFVFHTAACRFHLGVVNMLPGCDAPGGAPWSPGLLYFCRTRVTGPAALSFVVWSPAMLTVFQFQHPTGLICGFQFQRALTALNFFPHTEPLIVERGRLLLELLGSNCWVCLSSGSDQIL
ncbi:hypothetical protein BS78_08G038900 [Paspalum vaginatum]|nr:hypothetical protein BS78_08G038900 [Paspalum vaginatum]